MQLSFAGALPSQWAPSIPTFELPDQITDLARKIELAYEEARHVGVDFAEFLREEPWFVDGIALRWEPSDYPARLAELRRSELWNQQSDEGRNRPFVLFPGLGAWVETMAPMYRIQKNHGYRPVYGDIGETYNIACPNHLSPRLLDQIDRLTDEYGDAIDGAGHSLGGLVGRYLRQKRPKSIRRFYTLGSPWLVAFLKEPKAVNAWVRFLYRSLGIVRVSRDGTDRSCSKFCCKCPAFEALLQSEEHDPAATGIVPIVSPYDAIVSEKVGFRVGEPVLRLTYGGHVGLPAHVDVNRFILNDQRTLPLAA